MSENRKETLFALLILSLLIGLCVWLWALSANASPVGGSGFTSGVLLPGQSVQVNTELEGGETTIITVWGDGSGDLDCTLLGPGGVELAEDVGDADACMFSVAPWRTRTYHILVWNAGHASSRYRFIAQ
jgi:hypothetical protein